MEKKIAVYICSGCGIGEALDIEQLGNLAAEEGAAICRNHSNLCSKEGVDIIEKYSISKEKVICFSIYTWIFLAY